MLKVPVKTLLFMTGLLWLVASYMLISRAIGWSLLMSSNELIVALLLGLLFAFIKSRYIFIKLTRRNIARIKSYKSKVSLWEFHRNRDKILIVIMILMGIGLRHTPFIPKWALMPVYLGIGMAMFYVFLLYILELFQKAE